MYVSGERGRRGDALPAFERGRHNDAVHRASAHRPKVSRLGPSVADAMVTLAGQIYSGGFEVEKTFSAGERRGVCRILWSLQVHVDLTIEQGQSV